MAKLGTCGLAALNLCSHYVHRKLASWWAPRISPVCWETDSLSEQKQSQRGGRAEEKACPFLFSVPYKGAYVGDSVDRNEFL